MTWLDRQIATIFTWYRKRRMMRVIPGFALTFTQESEAKRRHKSTSEIIGQRKRIVTNILRVENGKLQ